MHHRPRHHAAPDLRALHRPRRCRQTARGRHHPHPPRTRPRRGLRLLHLHPRLRQPPPRRRRPGPPPHRRRPPGPPAHRPARRAGDLHLHPRPRRPATRPAPRRGSRAAARTGTAAAAVQARLKQISTAQGSLIHDLAALSTDPADSAAHAMRTRIHAHFTELHHEREQKEAQLKTLPRQAPAGNDIDLADELPMLPARLHELPERIQAALFAALDIQILWNAPMRQATLFNHHHRHHTRHHHRPARPHRGRPGPSNRRPRPARHDRHQQRSSFGIGSSPYSAEKPPRTHRPAGAPAARLGGRGGPARHDSDARCLRPARRATGDGRRATGGGLSPGAAGIAAGGHIRRAPHGGGDVRRRRPGRPTRRCRRRAG